MSNEKKQIEYRFSAIYGSISEQLRAQGYQFTNETTKQVHEHSASCIRSLVMRGYVTDSEKDRIYKRLIKVIEQDIVPLRSVSTDPPPTAPAPEEREN